MAAALAVNGLPLSVLVGLEEPEEVVRLLVLPCRLPLPALLVLPFRLCSQLPLPLLLILLLLVAVGPPPFWNICALAATEDDPVDAAADRTGDGDVLPLSRPTLSEAVNFLGTGICVCDGCRPVAYRDVICFTLPGPGPGDFGEAEAAMWLMLMFMGGS